MTAFLAGLRRGWIELRQILTSPMQLIGWLFLPAATVVVMYVLRGSTVPGTTFSLGTQAVPGILAMNVAMTGMLGLAMALTMDREDGTLLRAKATPNGMLGYVTGKVLAQAGLTVVVLAIVQVAAVLLFDGFAPSWLAVAWMTALGLVATLPLGAVLGSLFTNAQSLSLVTMLVMGLVVISGVYYPVTAMPEWLQWVAQVFPVYWLGLGLRSALLPDALAVAEIGGSWRHLATAGALGAWVVLGFVLAPAVLRRMARRESGASVAARRDRVAQRTA
ncbi:ABC transporter permease [Amycolatopsis minnesotensis]|uniref:ABC transporter permease n=1 Tax=Amycolatopsis minnesotensis TaxID=337894 RepID=A0ABN2Q919_9PSEU